MKTFKVLLLLTACIAIASTASIKNNKEEGRSLARIDATLKSYLGNPLTGLVYAASLAIGAISILAMYESPLSPLPVPSLPKPPVGRFPPENAVWPPIPKNAVKVKSAGLPYAASASNPVYAAAPQKFLQSAIEENNWLGPQNLVQNYQSALASGQIPSAAASIPSAAASSASSSGASLATPLIGSRRQDQVHAAHLQSYINQMSKIPAIRAKSPVNSSGQLAPIDVSTPAPVSIGESVKHSVASPESNSSSAALSSIHAHESTSSS